MGYVCVVIYIFTHMLHTSVTDSTSAQSSYAHSEPLRVAPDRTLHIHVCTAVPWGDWYICRYL